MDLNRLLYRKRSLLLSNERVRATKRNTALPENESVFVEDLKRGDVALASRSIRPAIQRPFQDEGRGRRSCYQNQSFLSNHH